ncbi:VOC family protein [Jannaschia sp. KMU-145]|uniref:VOC family protein n=1 Tax=Jannaschia halovivens TaxID=3388667 RepID=UPI00396AF123
MLSRRFRVGGCEGSWLDREDPGRGVAGVQLSLASEGGSGTDVPALSIEVDDLDATLAAARAAGAPIPYGPADEPRGVRRFFLTDPDGHLVNVLTHSA